MKKSLLATTFIAFPLSAKTTRLRTYGCIAIVLLAGCTATQTRWDATNIRKEVMVYYNDQIMDNLIRAKNQLPFVHVDITLLTSQGSSQITGTIGAGETRTNMNASKSITGMLGTITNAVMRPFAYSVSPQQTETLSIQAAPALGSQAIAEMSLPMTVTKETDEFDATQKPKKPTKVTNEKTPTPVTIYKLYENFAYLSGPSTRPEDGTYVPGTLKRWGTQYYYIANNKKDKEEYYELCKKLFIKGQSQTGSLERALQQTQAAAALPTR
jgi:hypothetical protein